jgi:hypothetical protein
MKSCKTCAHWSPDLPERINPEDLFDGECRRYPPHHKRGDFVKTWGHMWCGEWKKVLVR